MRAAMAVEEDRAAEAHLPLPTATFHVLLALVDGERHGWAIMHEVAARTGGAVRLGPGTLYGALRRLRDDGLVAEGPPRADGDLADERRRYHRLTPRGLAVVRAEARRLAALVDAARAKRLLDPEAA